MSIGASHKSTLIVDSFAYMSRLLSAQHEERMICSAALAGLLACSGDAKQLALKQGGQIGFSFSFFFC